MPAEVIARVHDLAEAQDIEPDLAIGNRDNRIIAQPYPDDDDLDDPTFEVSQEDKDISLAYGSNNINDDAPDADEDLHAGVVQMSDDESDADPLSTAAVAEDENEYEDAPIQVNNPPIDDNEHEEDPIPLPVPPIDPPMAAAGDNLVANNEHDPIDDTTTEMDAA
ncbi:hypothetical protein ACA910_006775 [Epithemia clementina (nom. ined.)]